ncbi:hypothetical protein BD779DRAFT_1541000 [Infundibulicybe gibba]|nr:hypothetical protein BD779DRAFT_1578294 [Infundibulicybe gibba]KAF8883147.1 hypothetical protein BD779DRAFT_1541000 [Infundibulicybe gibba]
MIGIGALVVSAITDYLAQMILLYRCWVIWSRQWVVVAVPGFLALVSLGGGLAFAVFSHSPLWSTSPENIFPLYQSMGVATTSISLAVNALAMSIIMTKILLTSPEVRPALGSDLRRSFHIVAAILIESGFLVLAFQLVFVVLFSIQHPAAIMIALPIIQIYGITPTLLNIRIVMGSAGDKTTTKSLSLRFAHPGGATTRTTGRSMSAVQAQSINIEPDNVSN